MRNARCRADVGDCSCDWAVAMVTDASCLAGKHPQPTGAAGPVSSLRQARPDVTLAPGPHCPVLGGGSVFPLPQSTPLPSRAFPRGPEPALFPEHSLNKLRHNPPRHLCLHSKCFPKDFLGARSDSDPSLPLRSSQPRGGWAGRERDPKVGSGLQWTG